METLLNAMFIIAFVFFGLGIISSISDLKKIHESDDSEKQQCDSKNFTK
jgi:hypothetical protein